MNRKKHLQHVLLSIVLAGGGFTGGLVSGMALSDHAHAEAHPTTTGEHHDVPSQHQPAHPVGHNDGALPAVHGQATPRHSRTSSRTNDAADSSFNAYGLAFGLGRAPPGLPV